MTDENASTPHSNWMEFLKNIDLVHWSEQFIQRTPIYYDNKKLWWKWERNHWEMVDDIDVLNSIHEVLGTDRFTTPHIKHRFLTSMQMVARENAPKELPFNAVQFKNCIVFLDVENGKLEEKPSTHEYFATNLIPWNYLGDNKDTPTIDKLFEDWVGKEKKKMLYELCAYSLMSSYPIHRIFCLIGGGRNGKSSFIRFLTKLIGIRNTTATDLNRLKESRFEAAKLYKKLVTIIAETNFNVLKDTALLKSLVGEDFVAGEFKNKNGFEFFNYAKLVIATNNLPLTADKSRGFYSRWIIIDFPNTFDEGKDIVSTIPNEEFEAFIYKCVEILLELLQRGNFTNEGLIEDRMEAYERKSNPVKFFIEEECDREFSSYLLMEEFFEKLQLFLGKSGYRSMGYKELFIVLRESGYSISRIDATLTDGSTKKSSVVYGLKWKEKTANNFV